MTATTLTARVVAYDLHAVIASTHMLSGIAVKWVKSGTIYEDA